MKRMSLFFIACLSLLPACAVPVLDTARYTAATNGIRAGVAWLVAQQRADGSLSDAQMPALTGLALWAMVATPAQRDAWQVAIAKATQFVAGTQQGDGGFYVPTPGRGGGGLGNYNTSVCVAALYATGDVALMPAVLKARTYIASTQLTGDDTNAGGFGYDKQSPRRYTDLNNTVYALDALARTQSAEEFRAAGEQRVDVNWDAALAYVSRMQNQEGPTAGGFAYNMRNPQGGTVTNRAERVMLRAYGSMTYAGVLGLVHAKLDRSDVRVRSAVGYCSRYWTLDENPGQGAQGLYFYYNIMARALSAAGIETIPRELPATDGVAWRAALVDKVLSLQRADGSWVNANGRWWENDPVLSTAYAVLALAFAVDVTR